MIAPAFRVLLLLPIAAAPAQQLVYQVPPGAPSTVEREWMAPFIDYDNDGYRDYLELLYLNGFTNQGAGLRISSGRDGTFLWTRLDTIVGAGHAGDVDGDGHEDLLYLQNCCGGRTVHAFSLHLDQVLWQNTRPFNHGFGDRILGNLDVDGDGRSEVIATTRSVHDSSVFVYNSSGSLRYSLPFLPTHYVISVAALGDLDDDGGDDFVIGTNDPSDRGELVVVSGRTGTTIRSSFGLAAGDRTSEHASNFGDLDGDGYDDYGAFPYWSAWNYEAVAYSGRTGAFLHSWPVYANSVVTNVDVDQDGVPDFVHGADYPVPFTTPQMYGSTRAISGRDGTELWRVDNFYGYPIQSNGSSQWMEYSASLGTRPGNPYPVVAWHDGMWFMPGTHSGRVRAYNTAFEGQSPVSGTPCTTLSEPPLIGARVTATGSRVTVARAPSNALAWLSLGLRPHTSYLGYQLPLDLTAFGLPGCHLYVPPGLTYLRFTGTSGIDRGYAYVDLPFQLTSATTGLGLAAQWLVFDPVSFDHAATAQHALRAQ